MKTENNLYNLKDRGQYFQFLTDNCRVAGPNDRILLATMEFRPDQEQVMDIVNALCQASQNGAKVTFLIDAYSLMLKDGSMPGPLFFRKRFPENAHGFFKNVLDSVQKLKKSGVECVIINKPNRALKNPFGGRSHIKFAAINDTVFIGGCNLSKPEELDVMVETKNTTLANYLAQFTKSVIKAGSVKKALAGKDLRFKIDSNTELLIDSGIKRRSLIYKQALDLIRNAEQNIYMTCQYFPNNVTPSALKRAHRKGVDIHLAYNHPHQHRVPIRGIQKQTIAMKKIYLPISIFENQLDQTKNYLHAKILLSEKMGIIGSHNFVKFGVNLGTAEIALVSTSPEFIHTAQRWIKSL